MDFEAWLEQQILTLSVDALNRGVLTCTACPKIAGDYIIEYDAQEMRMKGGKAYAFLKYVLETTEPISAPST